MTKVIENNNANCHIIRELVKTIMNDGFTITFSNEKNNLFLHVSIEGLTISYPFKVKWDPALQI